MFPLNTEILIVDDMKGIRVWLSKSLKQLGFENIHEAGDGNEALAVLKSKKIDLLMTDIVMPQKNGIELLKDMAKESDLNKIPKIVLSAETDREMIMTAIELGVLTYIIKPATLPVLTKKLEEAYKRINP